MKIMYGGCLISSGLYFIVLSTTLPDNTPLVKTIVCIFLMMFNFGLGLKLSVDYIINKIHRIKEKEKESNNANRIHGLH
jgi:pentose-5-phosphate-3-epimerase